MQYQPTRDCEVLVERLTDRADTARGLGRADEADRLLLLAWAAYDDPQRCFGLEGASWNQRGGTDQDDAANIVSFPTAAAY